MGDCSLSELGEPQVIQSTEGGKQGKNFSLVYDSISKIILVYKNS